MSVPTFSETTQSISKRYLKFLDNMLKENSDVNGLTF